MLGERFPLKHIFILTRLTPPSFLSIWFFHAKSGREGENPELRLIFFRLAKLLSEPFLPLFVFDGPKRPRWKRGIQISKKPHWMIHGVKTMITAFGFEWRQVESLSLPSYYLFGVQYIG